MDFGAPPVAFRYISAQRTPRLIRPLRVNLTSFRGEMLKARMRKRWKRQARSLCIVKPSQVPEDLDVQKEWQAGANQQIHFAAQPNKEV